MSRIWLQLVLNLSGTFLAYFPKMNVGLSNHQSVCLLFWLCLSICMSPLITSELPDRCEIWKGGDASQGDLDTIVFNHIASAILKWLRFSLVRWALLRSGLGAKLTSQLLTSIPVILNWLKLWDNSYCIEVPLNGTSIPNFMKSTNRFKSY
jgi:hypothetical protein